MAKVAIIGSGFVGRAWAISFARAGHDVVLWDKDPEAPARAIRYVGELLPELEASGLAGDDGSASLLARISSQPELAAALRDAKHVQENTPEDLATKQAIFSRLDELTGPDVVLASSTSALLPSSFTGHLAHRERCLVVHPLNPPYVIPAVEVVPAEWTSREIVERTAQFLRDAGHAPIVMQRELDGFVMNRMQGVLLEEAFRLVADGYVSAEDVDRGIREGLALRWSFMGPFETIDLNAPGGIRDYVQRYQGIYERLFPQMQRRVAWDGPVLDRIERERRTALPEDRLRERQIWRDRQLIALSVHKKRAAREIGE